jgi:hypothetical protein
MNTADIIAASLIASYVVFSIIGHPKPNLPLIAAPFLLGLTGIAFALGRQDLADQLGFSFFYLLVGGAVLFVIERVRERKRE